MLLIYIPKLTARNRYIIKTVFRTYLRFFDFDFTSDLQEYLKREGPKFSYTAKSGGEGVNFIASGLLEERGINEQSLKVEEYKGIPTLFSLSRRKSALPYDPFAAIFFMLSRYEEYLPHLRDEYDRFTAKESFAKQNDFLHIPVVDHWVMQIKEVLEREFIDLRFEKREFEFVPTIDIDNAFAYKEKGFLRTFGSTLRTISQLEFKTLFLQLKVLLRKENDPFDTYNYQLNIQKKYSLRPIYFFLLGDYGLNDKNLSHENRAFQSLIKSITDYANIGIHPSFGSNANREKLHTEIKRLERIVKREVKRSRQHFLKLKLPDTYRNLIEEDIQEDYTMGFANELGFRAGTCTPFPFYDLDGEVECNLKIFPFQVMESTLKYYLNLPIEDCINEIKKVIDAVKLVNGTFVSVWHNESLSDQFEWKGWREVYKEMIKYCLATSSDKL